MNAATRNMHTVAVCLIIAAGIFISGYFDGREQLAQQQKADAYQSGIREGRRLQAIADKNLACSTKEYLSRDPKYYTDRAQNLGAAK